MELKNGNRLKLREGKWIKSQILLDKLEFVIASRLLILETAQKSCNSPSVKINPDKMLKFCDLTETQSLNSSKTNPLKASIFHPSNLR